MRFLKMILGMDDLSMMLSDGKKKKLEKPSFHQYIAIVFLKTKEYLWLFLTNSVHLEL